LQYASGVIDPAFAKHAVSLTPLQLQKVKIIGETALLSKKMKNAFSVNGTACTMHAVSLTPDA
jgi:hypothetical protein